MLPGPEAMLTAFTLGLLGSGHCIAMCGGIAGAAGMRACSPGGAGTLTPALALPLQAIGRITSYTVLGALAGGLGAVATDWVPGATLFLRLLSAGMLVVMGLYVAGLSRSLLVLERLGAGVFSIVRQTLGAIRGPAEPLFLGIAWGLLPCGLVYATLTWSLASGSGIGGALLMAAFGAGTLPAVSGMAMIGAPLGDLLRAPRLRRVAGLAIVALGAWTLIATGAFTHGAVAHTHEHGSATTLDCHTEVSKSSITREG